MGDRLRGRVVRLKIFIAFGMPASHLFLYYSGMRMQVRKTFGSGIPTLKLNRH